MLGGGIILLVAAALWLVYLVPTWASRSRYNATERNAVRLNQALRILAETAETPGEIQLELDTRTAYEQQKLAKRTEAERLRLERDAQAEAAKLERAADAERVRLERETNAERTKLARQADAERAKIEVAQARIDAEREQAALVRQQAELARERAALEAAENLPARRQARARRVVRLVATILTMLGIIAAGVGAWLWIAAGASTVAIAGVVAVLLGIIVLQRMSAVATRAAQSVRVVTEPVVVRARPVIPIHDEPAPQWTPRALPQPRSSVHGSTAALVQDGIDARSALRRAALEEAARQRAAEAAPVRIDRARPAAPAASASPYAAMGVVSDEEIEAHVRTLLAHRAAG